VPWNAIGDQPASVLVAHDRTGVPLSPATPLEAAGIGKTAPRRGGSEQARTAVMAAPLRDGGRVTTNRSGYRGRAAIGSADRGTA
jgi:hypothetical protein